jgi:hypothetical protein
MQETNVSDPVARLLADRELMQRTSLALLANLKFAVWCLENPGLGPTPDALSNMKTAIAQAEENLN